MPPFLCDKQRQGKFSCPMIEKEKKMKDSWLDLEGKTVIRNRRRHPGSERQWHRNF